MPDLTDLKDIRDRYAAERARRLRPEGTRQYQYAEQVDDPWAEPLTRESLHDTVDVVLLGAGLSGLTCAAELRKRGVERIRLIDRAGDVGGTWYWNRYPGAQCDVESYLYLPLLEEMGYTPTERYVYQPEILSYLQSIAERFDLYRDACFQTEVVDVEWNDDGHWTVRTDRGDEMRARFVVLGGGVLQRPKLPGIPGIEDFEGELFHSSRWNYAYTGGAPGATGGGLPNLTDKRVGLIGTGATGLQIVAPVAAAARHLYLFQRTPVVVLPRENRPTDREWFAGLAPGWQRDRMHSFNERTVDLSAPDLVEDTWTKTIFPALVSHNRGLFGDDEARARAELDDLDVMTIARARIASIVEDESTAAALMPYFRLFCKRPSFHDDYLATFNRDNVTVVDTQGMGVQKATATGLVADGREYELDCVVLATGFDIGRGLLKAWGVDPVGRSGVRLSDHWGSGMRTFHGIHVNGFPNLFLNSATQVAAPVYNFTSNIVEMSEQIAGVIAEARSRGVKSVECTRAAEDSWAATLGQTPEPLVRFRQDCTPGYLNNEGDVRRGPSAAFMYGPNAFYKILRQWRAEGEFVGLEMQ